MVMTYAPCTYCRTEKPAPSGTCFNCGAPLLEVLGWHCGKPITDKRVALELVCKYAEMNEGYAGAVWQLA
jgi:predicted amidophosphoribosyltransferase